MFSLYAHIRNLHTCELTSHAESTCSNSPSCTQSVTSFRRGDKEDTTQTRQGIYLLFITLRGILKAEYRQMGTAQFAVLGILIAVFQVRFPAVTLFKLFYCFCSFLSINILGTFSYHRILIGHYSYVLRTVRVFGNCNVKLFRFLFQ